MASMYCKHGRVENRRVLSWIMRDADHKPIDAEIIHYPLVVASLAVNRPEFDLALLEVYGDVYLYHDTHLHPSKFFFPFVCIT
jgi:hypothetical protein